MKIFFSLLFLFPLSAFALETTPTVKVSQSIDLTDDLDFENLGLAVERQLQSYTKNGLSGEIRFGKERYPRRVLKDSLLLLRDLALQYKSCLAFAEKASCQSSLNQELNAQFNIYRPTETTSKYTVYYSPDLIGSRTPSAKYNRPIYRLPPSRDLKLTRSQIEYKRALAGRGLEIFWVQNTAFDIYLLHIEGGGRIKVMNKDGSSEYKYLSLTGHNNAPCEFVGKYLAEKGYLPPNSPVQDQQKWVDAHPEKDEEVFKRCQTYVYFRESDHEPVGRSNISLTVDRSLAIDKDLYRSTGIITFVKSKKITGLGNDGKVTKVPFSRFYLAQDTGSKIKGSARADLYFGYGKLAYLAAYNADETGEQYFLVKKLPK